MRIYSFMKEIFKVYIRASCVLFLSIKTENNNFLKEIKHVLRAFVVYSRKHKQPAPGVPRTYTRKRTTGFTRVTKMQVTGATVDRCFLLVRTHRVVERKTN